MKELVTQENNGNLTVTSLVVAEVFGIPHKSVLRNIDKRKDRHKIVPIFYKDSYEREQRMYSLNESQFLKLMPFIGGEKSEDGQDKLVDEFIRLREQQTNKNRHIDAVRSLLFTGRADQVGKTLP